MRSAVALAVAAPAAIAGLIAASLAEDNNHSRQCGTRRRRMAAPLRRLRDHIAPAMPGDETSHCRAISPLTTTTR